MKPFYLLLAGLASCFVASCTTTSLSNPGGYGHDGDLSLYGLTGRQPTGEVTESDIIQAGRGGGVGSLPWRGSRVLLAQSGAHQPDAELVSAFQPYCQIAMWDGRAQEGEDKKSAGATGRRLRLVAAQQNCSHVVVVFGEIQSDSRSLPTSSLVGWVPIVGDLLPTTYSGTRVIAQAIVLETHSPRYQLVSASPRQEDGLTTYYGQSSANVSRSMRMKRPAYEELAKRCFR